MSTKSPTSVKSREIIGVDAFSQRREVFDKHATVFLPPASPIMGPAGNVEPIITTNHGVTTANFKRNTTGYSSFRESKTDEKNYDFRPRKYSDNFTSEANQSDDVDYRQSHLDRSQRLSLMRRNFLASNLHEPEDNQFVRAGTRVSLPATRTAGLRYKFETNIHKFPFAEPYSPSPVRRNTTRSEADENGNEELNLDPKHQSLIPNPAITKLEHQKLFEELVRRYSPQRKPVDWTMPPTKPRVVASVPKSTSSVKDTVDKVEKVDETDKADDDEVFEKKENTDKIDEKPVANGVDVANAESKKSEDIKHYSESDEKNDRVTELSVIQRQISKEVPIKKPAVDQSELSMPQLIDKISEEGEKLKSHANTGKKVKRKRSFLDKLLGRKKDK